MRKLNRHRGNYIAGIAIVLLFGMISCSGLIRHYGIIDSSDSVTEDFERFEVNDALRYFISGSDLYPNAILGLRADARLDSKTLWREVAMTSTAMKEFVEGMKTRAFNLGLYLQGFKLITPDGRPVGVWYSIPQARTMLRVNDDKTIWIETPDIDTWDKFEIKYRAVRVRPG
jgi:hypothetical protein